MSRKVRLDLTPFDARLVHEGLSELVAQQAFTGSKYKKLLALRKKALQAKRRSVGEK